MTCAPFPPTHVPKPWGIALGYEGPGRRQMHARQYASEKKKPRTTGHGEAECKCRFRLWRCVAVVGKGKNAAEREERATEPKHSGQGEVRTQHGPVRVGSNEASKDSNPYETEAHGFDSGTVITNSRCAALHCQNPEKRFQ